MLRNVKLGKIFAVISLSALVWIWADLASDEQFPVYSATVSIVPSQPGLWVSFEDGASVPIREIVLEGPAARIAELDRRLKQGERLEFDFDAAQANMGSPGSYSLSLQDFLQRDKEIKRMGLKVYSCKPDAVSVTVSKLVKRLVEVQCRDQANNPVTAAVSPTHVNVLLPEEWPGPVAYVQLTESEKGA
ncbi:MAG: YbbR-like domain-containing protein, partial [Planctomycetota bacterium]